MAIKHTVLWVLATLLLVSCRQENPDTKKLVWELYRSPNDETRNAIVHAIEKHGLDPFLYDHEGTPVLFTAALTRSKEIIELLVEKGYPIDQKYTSAGNISHFLVDQDQFIHLNDEQVCEMLSLVLSLGADPNFLDTMEKPPLFDAIKADNLCFVQELLKAGADPNIGTRNTPNSLHWSSIFKPQSEIVRLLIESGADITLPDPVLGVSFCKDLELSPEMYPTIYNEYCA